eukprot:jgi/Mesvir1/2872/Mv25076-RA.1
MQAIAGPINPLIPPALTVDEKKRRIRWVLNKITFKKYQQNSGHLLRVEVDTVEILEDLATQLYLRAIVVHSLSSLYAQLCVQCDRKLPSFAAEPLVSADASQRGAPTSFRTILLRQCEADLATWQTAAEGRGGEHGTPPPDGCADVVAPRRGDASAKGDVGDDALGLATGTDGPPTAPWERLVGCVKLVANLYNVGFLDHATVVRHLSSLAHGQAGCTPSSHGTVDGTAATVALPPSTSANLQGGGQGGHATGDESTVPVCDAIADLTSTQHAATLSTGTATMSTNNGRVSTGAATWLLATFLCELEPSMQYLAVADLEPLFARVDQLLRTPALPTHVRGRLRDCSALGDKWRHARATKDIAGLQFERRVVCIARSYHRTKDLSDASAMVRELGPLSPSQAQATVGTWLVSSLMKPARITGLGTRSITDALLKEWMAGGALDVMAEGDMERRMLVLLLAHLTRAEGALLPALSAEDIYKGVSHAIRQLPDLALDVPLCPQLLGAMMGHLLMMRVLTPEQALQSVESAVSVGEGCSVLVGCQCHDDPKSGDACVDCTVALMDIGEQGLVAVGHAFKAIQEEEGDDALIRLFDTTDTYVGEELATGRISKEGTPRVLPEVNGSPNEVVSENLQSSPWLAVCTALVAAVHKTGSHEGLMVGALQSMPHGLRGFLDTKCGELMQLTI